MVPLRIRSCRPLLTGILVPACLAQALAGCAGWRTADPLAGTPTREHPATVRVTRFGGETEVLHRAYVQNGSLIGLRQSGVVRTENETRLLPEARAEIPLSEIDRLQVRATDSGKTMILFVGVTALAGGVLVLSTANIGCCWAAP